MPRLEPEAALNPAVAAHRTGVRGKPIAVLRPVRYIDAGARFERLLWGAARELDVDAGMGRPAAGQVRQGAEGLDQERPAAVHHPTVPAPLLPL